MLVLEATSKRQGERSGDYHWCIDGELAYNQVISCARIDCGCERGWIGIDSREATTTVQVVERPGLTVAGLAAELAKLLFDNGWISTNDPQDDLVAAYVGEIIEMANQFGEGAVLEREGEWVRERDGSDEPVDPLNRLALEEITEDVLAGGPMETIGCALALLANSEGFETALLDALCEAAWPEAQALGCAIDWLHHGRLIYDWNSVPRWLESFDQAQVSEAHRRKGNDSNGYVLTIECGGEHLGIASVCITHDGNIDSFFAISDTVDTYIQLMKTLQRSSYTPFRKVAPKTALREIGAANEVAVPSTDLLAGLCWPSNRPLLNFIANQMSTSEKISR